MNLAATTFEAVLKANAHTDDLSATRVAINDAMKRVKDFSGVDGVFI
jgi:hypothetical protein